jgi:RNA polymerase sigma-70 factor (ECF subfamily)
MLGWGWDVSDVDRAALRQLLVVNYESLIKRLSRRLGSPENAHEALHDTYLRLEGAAEIGRVRSPLDYLFRIALNIATDRRRAEARRLSVAEIDALLEVEDETPDASRVVEARSELRALERALAELPERRRLIFKAVLLDNIPRSELAKRFGITQRSIDLEVKRALTYGARHLRKLSRGFDSDPSESSSN